MKCTPVISIIFLLFLGLQSCIKEDPVNTDPGIKLRYSTDTLLFDTTFTTIGSATKILKIFNDESGPVILSRISIAGSSGVKFNFNVDGIEGPEAKNIRIEAKDSIYLFVRVKVDPDQPLSVSPFVLEDKLKIEINSHTNEIALVAWGQNANYITGKDASGRIVLLTCNMQDLRWDDSKPYLIYGTLVIDSCRVIIPAGARIYIHGGLVRPDDDRIAPYTDGRLIFINRGSLAIEGTPGNKAYLTGDRLEAAFKNGAGQWGGIAFQNPGRTNSISNADIKNSSFGLYVDSAAFLQIDHSRIIYTSTNSIIARNAVIKASNCEFTESGQHNLYFAQGGNYTLDYCTAHNAYSNSYSLLLDNFQCTMQNPQTGQCIEGKTLPATIKVRNSIFAGEDDNEVVLVDRNPTPIPGRFVVQFSNSYIKGDSLQNSSSFKDNCIDCLYAKFGDKLFESIKQSNYQLDSASVAKNIGKPIPGISDDLLGKSRDSVLPDAGCYESQK